MMIAVVLGCLALPPARGPIGPGETPTPWPVAIRAEGQPPPACLDTASHPGEDLAASRRHEGALGWHGPGLGPARHWHHAGRGDPSHGDRSLSARSRILRC